MVLLLNTFFILYFVLSGWVIYKAKTKKRKVQVFLLSVLVLIIYMKAQPSYLPKGDISRTSVPSFEASNAPIEDRNRKPVPSEVRQAEQERMYKEGPVFIQK